jgi:hypothetical protein
MLTIISGHKVINKLYLGEKDQKFVLSVIIWLGGNVRIMKTGNLFFYILYLYKGYERNVIL